MKGLKGFFWILFKCFAVYSLLVYALTYWVPTAHWTAGFLMMSLPVVVLINIFFLICWIFVDVKKTMGPLLMIGLGSVFLPRTYQFTKKQGVEPVKKTAFTVMNYNVYGFWVTPFHFRADDAKTDAMKEWIVKQNADILCMPEFTHDLTIPSFRNVQFLKKAGYAYYNTLQNDRDKRKNSLHTLAIFSKYPILNHKEAAFEMQNGLMYVDLLIRKDTVRVIGVHLYSMSLQLKKLVTQKDMAGMKRETRGTLKRMKDGFSARFSEIKLMESWIRESPYPVILCGDFNETPYSYFYGRTRRLLNNAFEEKGEGFGFTYNKIPWFIRIDNQFYDDKRLTLYDFKTWNDIKYSDHNPSISTYAVKPKE